MMNFKGSILLITLAFFLFPLKAQDSFVGIKLGYARSSLSGENQGNIQLNPRNAFSGALVFTGKVRRLPMGVSLEPGYILKGSRIDNDSLDYRFHYMNLPLLLDFYPIKKLKISAGLEGAYLVSAKNHLNDTTRLDLFNKYNKRGEVSLIVGVSYSLSYFADLGFRYNRSLTKISKQDAAIDRRNLYNQYLLIFLTFKIVN